ncbi:hypothetical protein, partial [Corynebacterium coyleae]|uniref:hypothetical protein n=1 Tax=Corynebacterium coyleae TaxID=53374 RepID=UPI001ADAA60E
GLAEHQHLINALLTELIRILTWHDLILPDRWVSPSTGIMTPQLKLYQPVEEGSLVSTLNHFNLVAASYRCNRDAPLESIQFLIDALPAGMPTGSMWLWEPETLRDTPTVVPIELEAWRRGCVP